MADMHNAEEVRQHVRVYLYVFGALAVLTVVTVAVAYFHLPIVPALIVALSIALIKGGLVASYFMHLMAEQRVIYWLLMLTIVFLIAMFIVVVAAYHSQEGGYLVP